MTSPSHRHGAVAAAAGFAVAVAVLAPSCATTSGPSAGGGVVDARRLYLTCAGSCHRAEPVKNYTAAEWATILPDMAEEARLDPAETEVLRRWIAQELAR